VKQANGEQVNEKHTPLCIGRTTVNQIVMFASLPFKLMTDAHAGKMKIVMYLRKSQMAATYARAKQLQHAELILLAAMMIMNVLMSMKSWNLGQDERQELIVPRPGPLHRRHRREH